MQATLGNAVGANATKAAAAKTTVQCNVGEKSPVLICSLFADKCETCHLELEFEEQEEVVFSVLGKSSVHLTGYYVGPRDGNQYPFFMLYFLLVLFYVYCFLLFFYVCHTLYQHTFRLLFVVVFFTCVCQYFFSVRL